MLGTNLNIEWLGDTSARSWQEGRPVRVLSPVAQLQEALSDATGGGAILMGPTGSGRRVVFDEAVADLSVVPSVVHLNGSAHAAGMRHGVLTFLLSQLGDGQMATRHELVHGLANLLGGGGVRAIVTLGSPDLIDAESATILAQLAAMRKIWLVPVCERLGELPEDVLALYRAGHMARICVISMDIVQTRAFLETEMGGPVSMFATAALWHLTRSNRNVLHGLVRELVAEGKLALEGGCWVMTPGPLTVGPTLTAFGARAMSGLGERGRRLLSVLALGGPITAEELRRSGYSDDVGPLRARGLLTIGEAPAGIIGIAVPLLGYLLRHASDDAQHTEVDGALTCVYPAPRTALILTEVQGMRDLGSYEALVAIVEEFEAAGGFAADAWTGDAGRSGTIMQITVDTLCVLGRHDQAKDSLTRAAAGLAVALRAHPEDIQLVHATQLLRVTHARIAVAQGQPETVSESLGSPDGVWPEAVEGRRRSTSESETQLRPAEDAIVGTIWASDALHFKALAVQAEAWAMTNRQQESLELVHRIHADIEGLHLTGVLEQVMSVTECAEFECALLHVQLLSGEWRAAADVAGRLAGGRHADIRSIAYGECVVSLLRGFSGEGDSALGLLLPALHQLAVSGESTMLSAIEGASAYCLVDQDRSADAVELLLHNPSATEQNLPLDFFSWAAEGFSSLAVSRLDTSEAATTRILALADKAHRGDKTVLEMNSLAMAIRLGRIDAAPRLQALCSTSPWAGNHGFLLLARGVSEADPTVLAEGLEHLACRGQTVYSDEEGNVLLEALGYRERRRVFAAVNRARRTDISESETTGKQADEAESSPTWLAQLTKREAQVAQRVISGMTNTAIARMNGVSVRTVEGHLYQVYSKLHVRNRQELTALDRASRRAVEVR